MLNSGFWSGLKKPVIGLAPMDGITDAAFRHIICKYKKPSFIVTEFTNVEGLARGAEKMLKAFIYSEIERPIIAQIYGIEVNSYYKCALMLCELGFDGIDINMGCPVNKVAKKGSGAGLIKTPALAKEIVLTVKKACEDYTNGMKLCDAGIPENIIKKIEEMNLGRKIERKLLPVSVKTRIGYDKEIAEEWVKHLIEVSPAAITMHGRTLKQMYLGKANWHEIAKAAKVCQGTGIKFLGNGDIQSIEDAEEKIKNYGVDGVMVGRAVLGSPWFFSGEKPTVEMIFEAAREHAKYFSELKHLPFHNIRKHLLWYFKGFDGAKDLRKHLMDAKNFEQVEETLNNYAKLSI